jgi:hypothetical protein
MESGEGELHLGVDAARAVDAAARSRGAEVVQ